MTEKLPNDYTQDTDFKNIPYTGDTPGWAHIQEAGDYIIGLAGAQSGLEEVQRISVSLMARVGVTSTGEWIESNLCSLLHVTTNGPGAWTLWKALWHSITTADVWIAPAQRPAIKLLICDMDSTLIPTESLDELAAYVGVGEQVAQITSRAMNGELDFVEALNERVGLLKGLDYSAVEKCVKRTEYNQGAFHFIQHAVKSNVKTVLVSGGFTPFADHVGKALGFDKVVANELEINDGVLTGKVLDPVVTKDTKLMVMQQLCEELGIDASQTCTIGDGANDIPMLQAAGTGIAYRAKNIVLAATPFHLSHAPLDTLIPMLPWS